ncbi:Pantoate--beta-alanine ligase [hydrothermal vent metagenome]|uniref:pantoate--beta-alanine ligase (AMP-forming) n=1 Tax=hydrothermal vent metagenome TaxID=652676 RepID=A0A3B0ZY48_9ZZZZ
MLVINSASELDKLVFGFKRNNDSIAFVPTMGNLHDGHLNLIRIAHQQAPIIIVSIFVNPLQFNQTEDLVNYPRTLKNDIQYCENNNVDILFVPSVNDIYPEGSEASRVELPELSFLSNTLEGKARPGHFSGVITVVKKLFELVNPDVAIFGEKDFQQLLIIRKMVEVLKFGVKIISSETIREKSGLAMSSRNTNLSLEERHKAALILNVLKSIRQKIISGEQEFNAMTTAGILELTHSGFQVDYLVVCDCDNLQMSSGNNNNARVILIAVWLSDIRLIDNLRIE